MSKFHERGFLDPISVFTRRECQAILHFAETTPPSPSWYKGNAAAYFGLLQARYDASALGAIGATAWPRRDALGGSGYPEAAGRIPFVAQ